MYVGCKKSSKRSFNSSSKTSPKASSCASERLTKARAELLQREVKLKNLLKPLKVERQMERQMAEMKAQKEELRHQIAFSTAEEEIEKAKVVDDLYGTLDHSKRNTKEEVKLLKQKENTEETRQSFPSVKEPQTVPHGESSLKHGDFKQVGRSCTNAVPNPTAQT